MCKVPTQACLEMTEGALSAPNLGRDTCWTHEGVCSYSVHLPLEQPSSVCALPCHPPGPRSARSPQLTRKPKSRCLDHTLGCACRRQHAVSGTPDMRCISCALDTALLRVCHCMLLPVRNGLKGWSNILPLTLIQAAIVHLLARVLFLQGEGTSGW